MTSENGAFSEYFLQVKVKSSPVKGGLARITAVVLHTVQWKRLQITRGLLKGLKYAFILLKTVMETQLGTR